MPSGKGRRLSFRERSIIAQDVAPYQPWQCSLAAKGMLTSQQEGRLEPGISTSFLEKQKGHRKGLSFRWNEGSNLTLPLGVHPLTLESEKLICGEKEKEEDAPRANCTSSPEPLVLRNGE